jgi:hypothetical protein
LRTSTAATGSVPSRLTGVTRVTLPILQSPLKGPSRV